MYDKIGEAYTMTDNWQCQVCGLYMAKSFVGEHRFLTGHKKIIQKDSKEVAREIIDSLNKLPTPFPQTPERRLRQ